MRELFRDLHLLEFKKDYGRKLEDFFISM